MDAGPQRKILVAVDGSESAREALRRALELAPPLGCAVTAVTAIQTRLPGYRAGYFSFVDRHILDELRKLAESVLEEARQMTAGAAGPLETLILEGEAEIFVQLAEMLATTAGVTFLVMGSCGHGVRERFGMGSTTQRLIQEISRRGMRTAVLVVP
jgi:nucleotide-binding universal stress UspA family protein